MSSETGIMSSIMDIDVVMCNDLVCGTFEEVV